MTKKPMPEKIEVKIVTFDFNHERQRFEYVKPGATEAETVELNKRIKKGFARALFRLLNSAPCRFR